MDDQNEQQASARVSADHAEKVSRQSTLLALAIAVIVVLGLIGFALTQTLKSGDTQETAAVIKDDYDPEAENAQAPKRPECPVPGGRSAQGTALSPNSPLRGVTLSCLGAAGQGEIPIAEALGGKPAVVNVWSWNCAPCRKELPLLQQWAAANPDVQLVGVHAALSAGRGAAMLDELGVNMVSYQDTKDAVGPALALPRVVPITVVLRADGTVARVFPGEFTSFQQLDDAVRGALT